MEGAATTVDTIITAFNTAAGTIVSNLMTLGADLVPTLLPALAILIVVGFGIKLIKRVTGR